MRGAALLALALSLSPAVRADDISDHYQRIEKMMLGEKARLIADQAEARRLETQRPDGAPLFVQDASCPSPESAGLWDDEIKTIRTDAHALEARKWLDDLLARIILANNLSVPALCGVVTYQEDYLMSTALERERPDGKPIRAITVSSGLLARLADDSQLAFTLSHELAHFVLKHALAKPRGARIALMTRAMSDVDDTMPDVDHLMRFGSGFSTEQEAQADALGKIFMHRAGYDLSRVPGLFETIHRYNTTAADGLLANHPSDDARIKASLARRAELLAAPVVSRPVNHLAQIQRLLAQKPQSPGGKF